MEEARVSGGARAQMVAELLDDFVEERVRQFPKQAFDIAAVRRALRETLRDGEAGFDLGPGDDKALGQLLDRHPFLTRVPGAASAWQPGLDKAAVKRAGASR